MSKNRPVSKAERNEILQSLGLSNNDMEALWKKYARHRSDVKSLVDPYHEKYSLPNVLQIYSWKDLTKEEMLDIPMMAKSPKEYADRKLSYAEQSTYNLIRSGYTFTEEEVQDIMRNYGCQVIEGDSGRWHKYMETIVKLCDRYFCIHWSEGLTEIQSDYYTLDSEFFEEVKPLPVVQITTKWISIDDPNESLLVDIDEYDLKKAGYAIKNVNVDELAKYISVSTIEEEKI